MIDLGSWAETLGLRRKKTFVERVQDAAEDMVDTVLPVLTRPVKAVGSLDIADTVAPALKSSSKAAMKAWERTERTASAGLSGAGDLASSAASSVGGAAVATGAAAAGVASGMGGFFGAIFSGLWWLVTFSIKAALLAGVAYAGWQWLQSRREQQSWSSPPIGGSTYSSSMYGTVAGDAGTSGASSAPQPAGAH